MHQRQGLISVNQVQQNSTGQHAREPRDTHVTIADLSHHHDHLAPTTRVEEGNNALNHEDEAKRDSQVLPHAVLPMTPANRAAQKLLAQLGATAVPDQFSILLM